MATHIRKLAFWSQPATLPADAIIAITGGASGIGQAVAYIYAKRYCRLVLIDINDDALERTALRCTELGAKDVLTCRVDVTDYKQCQHAFSEQIVEHYKTNRIDVLVLCAGINSHHLFENTNDMSVFYKLMAINCYGYLHCIKAAYNGLCQSQGVLVAITSFSGEVGLPYRTAYCTSKFAVTGLLESLRAEMKYVTQQDPTKQHKTFDIVIVCPPSVDTPLRRNSIKVDPSVTEAAPSKFSLTVDQCASAIVDSADRRLRKVIFPFTSFLANYLRPLIPDPIDSMIMKRAKL